MNIVETEYWCLMLPPEWSAEQDDDVIRIFDQDDIGELALTTLVREPDAGAASLPAQLAAEESPEVTLWSDASFGSFSGVTGGFEEDDAVVREWYLSHDPVLLYITYVCDKEDAGMDDAAVDEILGTLVAGDAISGEQVAAATE